MIPVGYMAKRVSSYPKWLNTARVVDIYSVSDCMSDAFADYIGFWKHNGYWFFDSPEIIQRLADEHSIDLAATRLFYYEAHELEFDDDQSLWKPFLPEPTMETQVIELREKHLVGYDVVTFSAGTTAECSPLSCNHLATELDTNQHCLLFSFKRAKELLEQGKFTNSEPGPFRIFAVHTLDWP